MGSRYLQVDVTTAKPEVLVARLLGRAVSSIRHARDADPESDGLVRTRSLRKAIEVIVELRGALDMERGGDVAQNLDALYEFVNHRLLTASIEPGPEALNEALRPLEIISSAWNELAAAAPQDGGP